MDNFATIADMVKEAESHEESLAEGRLRKLDYYQGIMKDTPADVGRSQQVTKDVRSTIKKVLPSITRTILGSDKIVEFLPEGEGDEDGAEQATDYINAVVIPECDAHTAIYDAVHDALLLRNGILKWWFEEKQTVSYSRHTGLTEDALGMLASDDSVEVLESTETVEDIEGASVTLYDVKLRRSQVKGQIKAAAVPRERFLIHPDAVSLEDSLITGEKTRIRRSDLVAMGYDREMVNKLGIAEEEDEESDALREAYDDAQETHRANQYVDYYDLFVRIDMDDDGVSELRHMCFAGGLKEKNLLIDEEVEEVQFCDLKVMDQPHQWEGVSIADDVMDIQRVKTVLLRQTLDNLYWQNNPQPTGQKGAIENPDALTNPEFGKSIWVKQGFSVRDAYGFQSVPFVARESFGMLEYMDQEAQERTGVSDASSGLAPDALQNMTAKASAMIEQQGIGQTEMLVQTLARGLRVFFRGLLRLSVQHQDVARTVRLRDEWVQFDPRTWNASMDCKVNTGLGAGTRERDMQMMQFVLGMQEKMIAGFGPDNPFVKPDNLSNALNKLIESAGLKTPGLYFTTPDPEEVAAQMEAQRNQPDPEQQKLNMQMQLEQAKMAANRDKEMAQMEADLKVKEAEIIADKEKQATKLAADAALQAERLAFDRQKWDEEVALRREEAAIKRQDEIFKHQAAQMQVAAE